MQLVMIFVTSTGIHFLRDNSTLAVQNLIAGHVERVFDAFKCEKVVAKLTVSSVLHLMDDFFWTLYGEYEVDILSIICICSCSNFLVF